MSKRFIEAISSAMTWVEEEVEFIIEGRPKKIPTLVIKGKGQQADKKNENGRLYSRKLWENSLKNPAVVADLQGRRLLGSCPHPKEGALDPTEASHYTRVIELHDDGEIYVEHVLMPTPKGKIVETLWRSGVQLGQSSRGDGESKIEDGTEVLEETNYRPRGWDFVTDPSVNDAFPTLVTEAKKGDASATNIVQSLLSNIRKRIESKEAKGEELQGYKELLEDVGLDPMRAEVLSLVKAINEKLAPSRTTPKKTTKESSMKKNKPNTRKRTSLEELSKRLTLRRQMTERHDPSQGHRVHQGKAPMSVTKKIRAAEECLAVAIEEAKGHKQSAIKWRSRALKAEERVNTLQEELKAAEQLINVSISNSKLTTTIESLLGENHPHADTYRKVLSKCRTKEGVEAAFETLEEEFNPNFKKAKTEGTDSEKKAKEGEQEKKTEEKKRDGSMASTASRILETRKLRPGVSADGKATSKAPAPKK